MYIYKYVSFPAFVDMIQRKELHFVLPAEWEDTEENSFVYEWAKGLDESLNKWISFLLINRIYAQSWTTLDESDAMWRIYGYGNQAIRITVAKNSIEKLDGVKMFPVEYNDQQAFSIYEDFLMVMEPNATDGPYINDEITLYIKLNV